MSAIGNEAPIAFAVSPAYARTHMVAAIAVPVGGCSSACVHLWITRDGGVSWHRAPTQPPGMSPVLVRGVNGESIVVDGSQGLTASDDDGASWHAIGRTGTPSSAPWIGDGAVVVAGRGSADYVVDGASRRDVPGSGGAADDMVFAATGAAGATPLPTAALLAARDHASGLAEVMRCNASLVCTGGAVLPGATQGSVADITLLPAADFGSSGIAFVRTSATLYGTVDGGRSYLSLTLPPHVGAHYTTIPAAVLDPRGAHTVYVALLEVAGTGPSQITAGGVFSSHDSGATWKAVGSPGPLDGGATSLAIAPGGRLFAGYVNGRGDAGLVCSDDGTRWQAVCGVPASCGSACATAPTGGAPAAVRQAPAVAATSSANAAPQPAPVNATLSRVLRAPAAPASATHAALARDALAVSLAVLLGGAAVRTRRRLHRGPSRRTSG